MRFIFAQSFNMLVSFDAVMHLKQVREYRRPSRRTLA
jgi:hypothetical protein